MTISARCSLPRRSTPGLRGLAAGLAVLTLAGCGGLVNDVATDVGIKPKVPPTIAADVERTEPVTNTGRPVAVLSVHMRKAFPNACKYGMTLTNNLPYNITTLTFKMTAFIKGSTPFETQNKSFNEVRPGERQYREMTFQQVQCSEIDRIEVVDPGRCHLGEMNRFNANPGDCARFSEIADSRLVSIARRR